MYINKGMHVTVLPINSLCLHFRKIFNASTSARLRKLKETNLAKHRPTPYGRKTYFSSCTKVKKQKYNERETNSGHLYAD